MTPMEQKLIETLIESVNTLSKRVEQLEATINKGKGAYMTVLLFFSIISTGFGIYKVFGK